MPSSGAYIPVPSFFGSAEVWPSRLVKLNVHISLCMCVPAVLACVCLSVRVCVVVLHFLLDCCFLEHA